MASSEDLQQTFSDICLLYELALAVGDSLDLRENCARVISTLMARKSFSYGAVWLRSDHLAPRSSHNPDEALTLELVYGAPRHQVRELRVALQHPMAKKLEGTDAVSVVYGQADFEQLVAEKDVQGGVISLFALGDLGLLKLHARTATAPLDEVELSQLTTVMRKFTTSLRGCLAHAGIVREIAERERAEQERQAVEQQLQQAQKMEAVGRLAGGIAHDFNNLLVAVLGNAELLARSTDDQPRLKTGLEAISTAARRAADLTSQLLAFSRKGRLRATVVPVDELVLEVVRLLARTIDPKIRIETELRLKDACVVGEAAQLHTVLLNLALNARDAMPGGGVLKFVTGRVAVHRHDDTQDRRVAQTHWVEIDVVDTGEGVPAEVADRVFEPFFTTKELGQGTGLGLAAAYGIVQAHGGEIALESRAGSGSTFRVRLPLTDMPDLPTEAPSESLFMGRGQVLLVDDDESARSTISQMLQQLGFDVVEARNGREALELLSNGPEVILMMIDLKMPVLDGVAMLQQLPDTARNLPIVAISGYAEEDQARALPTLGVKHVLQKPFSLRQLSSTLAARMGQAG